MIELVGFKSLEIQLNFMAQENALSQLSSNYPALGYRFKVTFNGIANNQSYPFQSVSMISVSNKSTLITDGGDHTREYKLPTNNKYKDVKLVRGLMVGNTQLLKWLENLGVDSSGRLKTIIVIVELMDANRLNQLNTIEKWSLYDCFPTFLHPWRIQFPEEFSCFRDSHPRLQ